MNRTHNFKYEMIEIIRNIRFGTNRVKKRSIFLFLTVSCLLFTIQHSQSQDLHFSQWYNAPLVTNPANTGFIPDADYRLGAHFRNQFSSILPAPYKTLSIFADGQLMRNRFENGWLGSGHRSRNPGDERFDCAEAPSHRQPPLD